MIVSQNNSNETDFQMVSGSLVTNGTSIPASAANSTLTHRGMSIFGEGTALDARVHRAATRDATSAASTLLLRRDGCFVTAVFESGFADTASLNRAQTVTVESLVRITPAVRPEAQPPAQDPKDVESATVWVAELLVLSAAKRGPYERPGWHGAPGEEPLPSSALVRIEERLDDRILDARVAATAAIFKLSSGIHELSVAHLAALDFYNVQTPTFIGYEYPGEEDDHFAVPYFGRTAWLTPTSEVHLGMALAADLQRVYDIHSVFRRESEVDGRHLTEV